MTKKDMRTILNMRTSMKRVEREMARIKRAHALLGTLPKHAGTRTELSEKVLREFAESDPPKPPCDTGLRNAIALLYASATSGEIDWKMAFDALAGYISHDGFD